MQAFYGAAPAAATLMFRWKLRKQKRSSEGGQHGVIRRSSGQFSLIPAWRSNCFARSGIPSMTELDFRCRGNARRVADQASTRVTASPILTSPPAITLAVIPPRPRTAL